MNLEIKEIFNLYEEAYGMVFPINECVLIPNGLYIQNKSVSHLVKKEKTDIYKITLSNDEIIYPSKNHPFMVNNKKKHTSEIKVGDVLFDGISVIAKEYFDYDYVYDFTVNTKKHTYMKAGVLHHNSLDEIPLNHQFDKVNFDTPSKEDFLRYMADRFTNVDVNTGEEEVEETITNDDGTTESTKVQNPISDTVYNAFADAFTNDDLGGKDAVTGIRVSPRRWEEIMKYINANIPVEDEHAARQLITFLRDNFKDYRTEEVSELFTKYLGVLKKIIKETSGIDATGLSPLAPSEWRGTLDSQIQTKMKLGDDRKYVPIISGMPGIGKCLHKDYEINVDFTPELMKEFLDFRNK